MRREIIRRSSSAIIAMIPTARRFCVGHVGRDEIDAGLLEAKQKVCVPAEAINLRDDELGAVEPACLDSLSQDGSIRLLPTLDLDAGRG